MREENKAHSKPNRKKNPIEKKIPAYKNPRISHYGNRHMNSRVRIRTEQTDDEQPRKKERHRFKKGDPRPAGAGRKKGSVNRVSMLMKDAILIAAELEGSDRRGKDGLIGYFRMLSRREPVVYGRLLEKLLPLQITGKDGGPMQMVHTTKEELEQRLKERGLPLPPSLLTKPTHEGTSTQQ